MSKRIKKAIFPVAGLGTRFLPATKVIPKEMIPILDKPVIQYAVEEAMEAGIEEFIFITGRGKVMIEDHFDISYELESHLNKRNKDEYLELIRQGMPKPGKAFFTRQQYPLGLGHAIWCAKVLVENEAFAVLLPDEFLKSSPGCLKKMIDLYNLYDNIEMMAAVQEVAWNKVSSYGILNIASHANTDFNKEVENHNLIKVKSMIEKPAEHQAPSNLAVIGRYILPSKIFDVLEKAKKGAGGEIQLTDSMSDLISDNNFYCYKFAGERFDCGNPVGLLEATINMALLDSRYNEQVKEIIKKIPLS